MEHSIYKTTTDFIQEWQSSAIDNELIELNLISFEPNNADHFDAAVELVCPKAAEGANAKTSAERKLSYLQNGAWGFYNNDLDDAWTGWGIVKPNTPRTNKDGKPVKYETQWGYDTEIFLPKVSEKIWRRICDRYNLPYPDFQNTNFWRWVTTVDVPVFITEGLKKQLSLLSQGYVCLGLSGIHAGYRAVKGEAGTKQEGYTVSHELRESLLPFLEVTRPWFVCFDRDSKHRTIRDVNNAGAKLATLINKHYQISAATIVRLPANKHKGVDDFLAAEGIEAFEPLIREAASPVKMLSLQERDIPYHIHVIENQDKYLGNLNDILIEMSPPEKKRFVNAKILGLRAAKGTGKTTAMADLVAEHLATPGNKVLVITHRIQLGRELSRRLGVPYVDDATGTGLHAFGFGLCVDSLHKQSKAAFKVADYTSQNVLIIIDEAEQVIDHLLTANTEVAKRRVEILKNLQEIFSGVLDSSDEGKIVLADADLSYLALQFVQGLAGAKDKQVFVIDKRYSPVSDRTAHFYSSSPELLAKLVADVKTAVDSGKKIWVALQGQKDESSYSTKNIERRLHQEYAGLRVLRIDAESTSDPTHPAFGCIDHLNEVIANYDVILASPSVSTGVSVDRLKSGETQFHAVYSFMMGVTGVGGSCQAIERVREDCDRHIFAAERGLPFAWMGHSAITTKQEALRYLNMNSNIAYAFTKYHDEQEIRYTYDQAETSWIDLVIRHNNQMWNYREAIKTQLLFEGYKVVVTGFGCDLQQESAKQSVIKDVAYAEKREKIIDAEDMTRDQYEESKNERQKTEEQRLQEQKYLLRAKYGVDVSDELIQLDGAGWYGMLQKEYLITRTEQLVARDKSRLEGLAKDGDGVLFKPDVVKATVSPEIWALAKMGVKDFLNAYYYPNVESIRKGEPIKDENCFNPKDCDLLTIFLEQNKLPHNAKDIKSMLGVNITEKTSATNLLGRVLAKLGFGLEAKRKNKATLYYITRKLKKIDINAQQLLELSDEIFKIWESKNAERVDREKTLRVEQAAADELNRLEHEFYGDNIDDYRLSNEPVEELMACPDFYRTQLQAFWERHAGCHCKTSDRPKKQTQQTQYRQQH